jgi:hypothetical protein
LGVTTSPRAAMLLALLFAFGLIARLVADRIAELEK